MAALVVLPIEVSDAGWLSDAFKSSSKPDKSAKHAALPKRLGNFPFWRGQEKFLDALGCACVT